MSIAVPITDLGGASFEDRTYAKVAWRLIPFLIVCYVVAYLDRVNVGFAKLQMLSDLKFSDTVYGLGAGVFFVAFLLRSTHKFTAASHWRPQGDYADHDHLGSPLGVDHVCHHTDAVLYDALSPRGRRSRIFSGHDFVSHFLVSR